MAQQTGETAIQRLVAQVVDHAKSSLDTSASGAQDRQTLLQDAKKQPGNNHLRTLDIQASLDAEERLVADAHALVHRLPTVRQTMIADLERLVALALETGSSS